MSLMHRLPDLLRRLPKAFGEGVGRTAIAAGGGGSGGGSVLLSRGSIRHVAFYPVPPLKTAAAVPVTDDMPAAETPCEPGSAGQTIVFSGVGLDRGGMRTLAGIDLVLGERRIGLLGLNGSGKSSLLKLMVGLLSPTSGSVSIDGLSPTADAAAVRRRTGFLFQSADNQIVYCPSCGRIWPSAWRGSAGGGRRRHHRGARPARYRDAGRTPHPRAFGRRAPAGRAGRRAGARPRAPSCSTSRPRSSTSPTATGCAAFSTACRNRRVVVTHDLDLVAGFDRVLVVGDGRIVADGRIRQTRVAFYRRRYG